MPGGGVTVGPPGEGGLVAPELHSGGASQAAALIGLSRERAQAALADAEGAAARILEGARQEAARLIEAAQAEMAAERSGLEARLRSELEAEYRARFEAATAAFAAAARQLSQRAEDALAGLEEAALELVLAIARRLLYCEWEAGPEALGRIVSRALASRQSRELAVLALSPALISALGGREALAAALAAQGLGPQRLSLREDPELSAAQFRLELPNSLVEFDLERAMAEVEALARRAALDPQAQNTSAAADESSGAAQ